MSNLFDLTGKRALITGSTQGLGLLMATGLAEQGAEVIINGRSAERCEQAVRSLQQAGLRATGCAFDVTDPQAVAEAIEMLEATHGPLDILVNNAGVQHRHPFTEFPLTEWDNIVNVNQKSVFLVSQQVAKRMITRRRGKIINLCSMQSELGRENITPYAASKGAVKMLTKGMCVELARYNIQVNGIAPGYFDSEMTAALVNDKGFSEWLCKRTPAARWGKPEELKGAAVFLSAKASDFVNGHILFVDGGMLASV
ncbi:gluconate 5-dehydrogenase [Tatumella saanichensis]|uniref:gluconate 5-dehydrogenase n=1 Tax=Tatumella saanichensis TaxID=480813 RepID=UPI0004A2D55C|nr:gluconate 5-dehydrogenase [Tatumella saanichensis]